MSTMQASVQKTRYVHPSLERKAPKLRRPKDVIVKDMLPVRVDFYPTPNTLISEVKGNQDVRGFGSDEFDGFAEKIWKVLRKRIDNDWGSFTLRALELLYETYVPYLDEERAKKFIQWGFLTQTADGNYRVTRLYLKFLWRGLAK